MLEILKQALLGYIIISAAVSILTASYKSFEKFGTASAIIANILFLIIIYFVGGLLK